MKNIILSVAVIAAFAGISTPAFAYTIVDGQPVFGYVRGVAPVNPMPTPDFIYQTAQPVLPVIGNTRVVDLYNLLQPQDKQAFLNMIARTHLFY